MAGEIFAPCDVFNGRAIFAEHFELVPVVAWEMVVKRFSADGASYPLCRAARAARLYQKIA
jgi:hypothetical protein